MSEQRRGFLLGAAAYVMWGLFPLYWRLLEPAGAVEILAHRIVWSLVVMVGLTLLLRRTTQLRGILHDRRVLVLLCLASVVIGLNWGGKPARHPEAGEKGGVARAIAHEAPAAEVSVDMYGVVMCFSLGFSEWYLAARSGVFQRRAVPGNAGRGIERQAPALAARAARREPASAGA